MTTRLRGHPTIRLPDDQPLIMVDYTQLKAFFEALELQDKPIIAHASLKPFGFIEGGPQAVLDAMLASFAGVIMPAFTYKTEIIPESGPPDNGITYGSGHDLNLLAEPFQPLMPADRMMGILPETLRKHPSATRSPHPILSFAGIHADPILSTQTLDEPLAPIGGLAEQQGWVVLINVDHTVNTSIHYAEKLAGRKQFTRWAFVGDRVVECPGYPGDSLGFQTIAPHLTRDTRRVEAGQGFIQAVPLRQLFRVVQDLIRKDPLALLCDRPDCERCQAIRGVNHGL